LHFSRETPFFELRIGWLWNAVGEWFFNHFLSLEHRPQLSLPGRAFAPGKICAVEGAPEGREAYNCSAGCCWLSDSSRSHAKHSRILPIDSLRRAATQQLLDCRIETRLALEIGCSGDPCQVTKHANTTEALDELGLGCQKRLLCG